MKSRRQDTRTESDDRIKDANLKLRAENRKLKKKVAQLQKELLRCSEPSQEWEEELEESFEDIKVPVEEPKEEFVDKCPKCKNELTIIPAGIFVIRKCESCGTTNRKRVDKLDLQR